ncbi:L-asparagine oxygenase [Amycolatopsis antarctica]|uniref:L-asparagine oxygenase n=1 Tax=Amycolatopsis antarctica TaxID=1854586 RepID=A0A263D357_9PSEU|nr:TauD/TfdA family dioxygenase [Amycolatopsis antarctica]OZM72914.1 L-asparagine oxygenase [Amycolatopsis antarctica]
MQLLEDGSSTTATLADGEYRDLDRIARELLSVASGTIDSPTWVAAARDAWEDSPADLRRALSAFRRHSGSGGALVIRNLPVDKDNLPDTPSADGSVLREATVSAATLMLIAHGLGDPGAFRAEKSGALVQNVVPVPGREELQANSGSVRLTFHTENAFHQHRPDFVLLLCVRPDHEETAELRTVCSRQVLPKLSEPARESLCSASFLTEAPPSFGDSAGKAEAHPVLPGDLDDPNLRIDEAATTPLTPEAEEAKAELSGLFESSYSAVRLKAGDLAIVDNRVTVHGRSAFTPRYDGRDRWLQRTFAFADLRRSRDHRDNDGHVLER